MQASKLELALELAKAGDQQAIAECLGWVISQELGWEEPERLLAVDTYLVDGCFVLNFGSPRPLPKELLVSTVRRELPQFPLTGITRVRVCAWRTQAQAGEKIPVWSSDFWIEPQYRRAAKTPPPPLKLEAPRRRSAPMVPRRVKPRRWPMPWLVWVSIPLFGLLGAGLRLSLQPPPPAPIPEPSAGSSAPAPTATPSPGALTLANFEQVQEGMDLATVQALLGSNGQAIAETEVAGSKAQVFSWKNADGSNAIVEFRDGKVTAKAQAGLL
ncbi:MAG: hypothetical protein ACUVSQ_13220 [Pseudanabaenaceae cyanobacterium]